MGFIGSSLGFDSGNSGGAGLNYQAGSANLLQPVTNELNTQYNNASETALQQQQNFVTALQGQNGIANQSNVFNQQQGLANQLQGVANGTGPNPALAQLNQQTAANTANQAALMAGQRGTSSNAGLLARQVAQQGAANQQNAVGQSATLQANQQLAGMSALAQQQANLANLATNQVGQQGNATQAYTAAEQNQQNMGLNATAAYNNSLVGNQSSQNSSNASVSQVAAQGQNQLLSGALGGAGSAFGLARGGVVPSYADGAAPVQLTVDNSPQQQQPMKSPGPGQPQSAVGQALNNPFSGPQGGGFAIGKGLGDIGKAIGSGVKSLFGSNPSPTDKLAATDASSLQGNGTAGGELAVGQTQDQAFNDMQQAMAGLGDTPAEGNLAPGETSDSALSDMENATPDQSSNYTPGNTDPNVDHGVSAASDDAAIDALAADGGSVEEIEKLAPLAMMLNKGGPAKKVPAMVSPGEAYISPDKLRESLAKKQNPLKKAEIIPGKAKVKGDSLKNDIVPKTLEEGGLVIPRSVMGSKTPMKDAIKFIHTHMKNSKATKKV